MNKKFYILILCTCILFTSCRNYPDFIAYGEDVKTPIVTAAQVIKAIENYTKIVSTPTALPTSTPIPKHDIGIIELEDTSSNLRVRSQASKDSQTIGAINHGLTVVVLNKIDDYYEIIFDGEIAYSSCDYIKIDNTKSLEVDELYYHIPENENSSELRPLPSGITSKVGIKVDIDNDGKKDGKTVDTDNDGIADSIYYNVIDDLIDVEHFAPKLMIEQVFATEDNFTKKPIYSDSVVLLQEKVLDALLEAEVKFNNDGYKILLYDAYRPLIAQEKLFNLINNTRFANNPTVGSNHNRGCAIDITLVDRDLIEIEMPSKMHQFDETAYRHNENMNEKAKANLEYMTSIMESCGFISYNYEWWHFNYKDAKNYALSDHVLDEVIKLRIK